MTIEEEIKSIDKIIEEIMNDPELPKKVEEYQRKYGTLTEEDLRKQFTI